MGIKLIIKYLKNSRKCYSIFITVFPSRNNQLLRMVTVLSGTNSYSKKFYSIGPRILEPLWSEKATAEWDSRGSGGWPKYSGIFQRSLLRSLLNSSIWRSLRNLNSSNAGICAVVITTKISKLLAKQITLKYFVWRTEKGSIGSLRASDSSLVVNSDTDRIIKTNYLFNKC